MTAAVVVELPPAEVASTEVHALRESCSVAMRRKAVCLLSQDLTAGDQSAAVAIVAWEDPSRVKVRIDVGLQAGESARWQSRELSFSAKDPEIERWRSVGFAIATLVGNLGGKSSGPKDAPAPQPQASASLAGEAYSTGPSPPLPSWWLDGQFLMRAIGERSPAYGGQVRVSRLLGQGPWFLAGSAQLSLQSVSTASAQLSVAASDLSAGLGLVALRLGEAVQFVLRLEPMVELVEASGRDLANGRSDRGSHVAFGLREATDASWMWSRRVGLVFGAELSEATGATDILVGGELVARVPAVDVAVEGGIRFALP